MVEPNRCACGCGGAVTAGSRYLHAHHWRAKRIAAGIPDEKTCQWCEQTYRREDVAKHQSNKHWVVRQFCGEVCRRAAKAEYNRLHEAELSPSWVGDEGCEQAGRKRARRIHASQPCEVCGNEKSERHHIDANTLNNDRSNIAFLCRKHHIEAERAAGLPPRNSSRRRVAA